MSTELAASRKKMILADISLLIVALFWGSNFVVMKAALEIIPPFTYLGLRFMVAAFIAALIFWKKIRRVTRRELLIGSLIGFFLFAGFGFQTIGLLYTTPAKSGFITGTAVVIVPFLYIIVTKKSPGGLSFLGAILAAAGLFLLSASKTFGLEFGDGLTFISAILFASHIVTLGVYAPRLDPIALAVVQMAFVGLANLVLALLLEPVQGILDHPPIIWGAILYAVLFCTIGAFVTQTVAQRFTLPTHAALILSTEAVFAGLFSFLFWNELFTVQKLAGALLIFVGVALTELKPLLSARTAAKQNDGASAS